MSIITSAKTSRKQIPAIYQQVKKIDGWRVGSVNLDIGGGKWDLFTNQLRADGVKNLIFDPYNRDEFHNAEVLKIAENGVDTVTVSNVLNVIPTKEDRLGVLRMAKRYNAVVYITIYEGTGGEPQTTRDGWQENRSLSSYMVEVTSVFLFCRIDRNKLIVAEDFS